MALKAGRVGIDPKYVDATGKPVIGPDPGPTPTGTTLSYTIVAENVKSATLDIDVGDYIEAFFDFGNGFTTYYLYRGTGQDAHPMGTSGGAYRSLNVSYSNGKYTFTCEYDFTLKIVKIPGGAGSTKKTVKRATKTSK